MSCISQKTENEHRTATDRQTCIAIMNLQQEVMSMHDSIMPSISTILHLKRELKIRLQEGNIADEKQIREIHKVVKALEDADQAMMRWMQNHKTTYEGMKEDEIQSYLKKEKQQINKVGEKIVESMKKAKVMLASN
jgi:hypothetical protein